MADPKYIFNDGLYHVDGYRVPDDEPVMVFRGKDVGSLVAICEYIHMLEEQPQNKNIVAHLESSLERLFSFYTYQINNEELQSVGCSRRCHSSSWEFILSARRILEQYGYDV